METPSWTEYIQQPYVKDKQMAKALFVTNENNEIVGIKTNKPYPVSFLRIKIYETSMNMNKPTVYAFDERGETWAYSDNLKDIIVGVENWINNTSQSKG